MTTEPDTHFEAETATVPGARTLSLSAPCSSWLGSSCRTGSSSFPLRLPVRSCSHCSPLADSSTVDPNPWEMGHSSKYPSTVTWRAEGGGGLGWMTTLQLCTIWLYMAHGIYYATLYLFLVHIETYYRKTMVRFHYISVSNIIFVLLEV